MRVRLNRPDQAKVGRSRRLWRSVHDELRDATGWRPCREEWTLAGRILPCGTGIRAVLTAMASKAGVAIRSHVEIGRHSKRDRVYVHNVRRVLKGRGYEQSCRSRPDETTFLSRSVSSSRLSAERSWLASFLGGVDDAAPSSPRSVAEFSDCFHARRAGPWLPYRAAWERRRAIEIAGRKMQVGLMFHLAPRDLRGFSIGLATSIAIWPSWNGQGPFPRWLEDRRSLLARQFRAAGHRAEWHRGPKGRGVGIMSLVWPKPPVALHRVRLMLDAVELGDGPGQ